MARQNYNDIFNEEDSTSSNSNMEPTQAPHFISWEETKLEECKRRLEDVLDTFSKIDSMVSDLDGKISQLEKSASILHSSLESLKDRKELENELGNITVQIADKSYTHIKTQFNEMADGVVGKVKNNFEKLAKEYGKGLFITNGQFVYWSILTAVCIMWGVYGFLMYVGRTGYTVLVWLMGAAICSNLIFYLIKWIYNKWRKS